MKAFAQGGLVFAAAVVLAATPAPRTSRSTSAANRRASRRHVRADGGHVGSDAERR